MKKIIALMLLIHICNLLSAQEEKAETFVPKHSIGLNIGHEHAFSGVDENNKREISILPYWGLDYNFQFAPKWAIGLHTDFIVENFKVEKNLEGSESEIVERSFPVAPAVVGFYKPTEHWSFGFGAGAEFAKEESYFLNRVAIEYAVEIRNRWEVFGVAQYDFRWNAYDTWTIGLGIAKSFGKKSR